ncbi:ABC-type branched-subunit amino acid transport system substrate-binding protein [Nocardioides massiliensis]|uniref:ABC-type branched-subunit amino acid transport system substrate-binding protein n=2 Tax=Nocardioides massiliensis TaxID=1325935 RepID=A0ABT9NMA4_9ACTN|nr:ABC transporter substrate-binding protein [Nocardioides massiliensis]MDP9821523.1 ABC-type branched-subunit amino acid transport system substrate-binding protein [Nocardioides massiliensis]
MSQSSSLPRRRGLQVAVLLAAAALVLTACGHRLGPEEIQRANAGTGAVTGTAGGSAGADGVLDAGSGGADDGVVAAGDPGAPAGDTGGATSGSTRDAGGGGGGAAAPGGGGGSGGTPSGSGENSATGGTKAGACEGFANQTGITGSTIRLANVSDISGPIPGLFQATQDATRAYVAYFNANSDICGRKLELDTLDSRSDTAADQAAYQRACSSAFAAVGSMSAFDSGGAKVAQNCKLPDVRSSTTSRERNACTTCLGAQTVNPEVVSLAALKWFQRKDRASTQKSAWIHIRAGSVPDIQAGRQKAAERIGFKTLYSTGIDLTEFNYAPFVQQMKSRGVEYVDFVGSWQQAVRLAQAMKQQSYSPKVVHYLQPMYTQDLIDNASGAVENVYLSVNHPTYTDTSAKEMQLYLAWLQQVKPGARPTTYGVYAWSAARLFVETSIKLGGKLNRDTLNAELKKVRNWTANDLHAGQNPGTKRTGECTSMIQVKGGKFTRVAPAKGYLCEGLLDVKL